jgi:uncharacterized protein YjbI with pentapeptide repeats
MLFASDISCSRSNVLVPVSAWSSPAESVSRPRCASAISLIVWSNSALRSSRRSASAARIFSVSAADRVGRTGAGGAATAAPFVALALPADGLAVLALAAATGTVVASASVLSGSTGFARAAFAGVDFAGVDFAAVDFAGVDFAGVDFAAVDFAAARGADAGLAAVDFVAVGFAEAASAEADCALGAAFAVVDVARVDLALVAFAVAAVFAGAPVAAVAFFALAFVGLCAAGAVTAAFLAAFDLGGADFVGSASAFASVVSAALLAAALLAVKLALDFAAAFAAGALADFAGAAFAADLPGGGALVTALDFGPVAELVRVPASAAAAVFLAAAGRPVGTELSLCAATSVTRTPAFSLLLAPPLSVTICAGIALFGAFRTDPARSAMASPRYETGTRRGAAHSESGKDTEPTFLRQTCHTLAP